MTGGGSRAVALALVAAALVGALGPSPAAAQGDAPSDGRTGLYLLPPSAIFHQFGFNLATNDIMKIRFTTEPRGSPLIFSLHLHLSSGIREYINRTEAEENDTFVVPADGLYMPQWVNPNPYAVNLTYAVLVYHYGGSLALPNIPFPLLLLTTSLGGAVGGLQLFLWWRRRRGGP